MIVPLLTLPSIQSDGVAARRQLGRGLYLPFHVAGQAGELRLEPGRAPVGGDVVCFDTQCGVLALAKAGPLLSLLGECPVTLAGVDNEPDSWFWTLFQYYLSPEVRALLGYVRLLHTGRPKGFGCRLTVTLGASWVEGYVWLSSESFWLCTRRGLAGHGCAAAVVVSTGNCRDPWAVAVTDCTGRQSASRRCAAA